MTTLTLVILVAALFVSFALVCALVCLFAAAGKPTE